MTAHPEDPDRDPPSTDGEQGTHTQGVLVQAAGGIIAWAVIGLLGLVWRAVTGSIATSLVAAGTVGLVLALLTWTGLGFARLHQRSDRPWYLPVLVGMRCALVVSLIALIAGASLHARKNPPPSSTTASPRASVPSSTSTPPTTSAEPTTSASVATSAAPSLCTSPPVVLTADQPVDEHIDVTIAVSCPPPEGQKHFLISQIDDIGTPPHTEYYVLEDFPLDRVATSTFRWNFAADPPGLARRLYVVAVTPAQEERLTAYYNEEAHLTLHLPVGLAPISNTVEHTR